MVDISGIKAYARRQLQDHWTQAVLLALLYLALNSLWEYWTPQRTWYTPGALLGEWLGQLIIGFLTVGVYWCFLDVARQGTFSFATMLEPFGYFIKTLGVYICSSIGITVGLCLFVIPGVILLLGFSQVFFLLRDRPELGVFDILFTSWQMMDGYKMEFLILNATFIGWFILGGLTWGLGYLYAYPYWYTTRAAYYNYLLEQV